jgi:hypothetical protein
MLAPPLVPRRRRWRLALLFIFLLVAGLVAAVASTVMLSRDAAWLRDELAAERGEAWTTRLQVSAGWGVLTAARAVVSRIDDVPPEARLALAAVRRASVGIYELQEAVDDGVLASLAIPEGIPGWERIVTVRARNETVVIYAKAPRAGANQVDVAIGVRERTKVVIVSATVAPEGLMALVGQHAPRPQLARAH